MTPQERVLTALDHRASDRVPVDFSGHRSSGISAIAYGKLRKFLGFPEKPIRVYDPIQQLAIVDDDILERFGVDTIELGRAFAKEDSDWADWTLPDGSPCQMPVWALPERDEGRWVIPSKSGRIIATMPDGALYFEQAYYPFYDSDDLDKIPEALDECMWCAVASPPGPLGSGTGRVEGSGGGCEKGSGRKQTKPSSDSLGAISSRLDSSFTGTMGSSCYWPRIREGLGSSSKGLVEMHLANLERFLGAVGGHIDVVLFGDDLGMQSGPQISPAMYRDLFKPHHSRMWRMCERDRGCEGDAPLLRGCAGTASGPDRCRSGCHQPSPDLLPRDGCGDSEKGFR